MNDLWREVGWPAIRLTEIADLFSGGTPSRKRPDFFSGNIPWLTGQDIPEGRVTNIENGRESVGPEAIKSSATRVVPANTVLITTRVTVGKTAVAACPLCFSQDVTGIVLRSDTLVTPHFLAYFLLSQRSKFLQRNQGSTIAGITRDNLALERVPLPPLSEQRRIVDILREAEQVRRLRSLATIKEAQVLPAVFFGMFGDLASGKSRWPLSKISDFVAGFVAGRSLSDVGSGEIPGGLRVLKISAITSGRFDQSESKPAPTGHTPAPHHFVKQGDLLISRANTAELVGATALVEDCLPNLLLPDKLWRIVWKDPANTSPEFMSVLFRMPSVRHKISATATGTGGSMKNIGMQKLMALRLSIPPSDLQLRFGKVYRELRAINYLSHDEAIVSAMGESLFARAFTGKLTAYWREKNTETFREEVELRDQALDSAGAIIFDRANESLGFILDAFTDRLAYSDLSRDQHRVLEQVKRNEWKQQDDGKWQREESNIFTAAEIADALTGPLHGNAQAVESNLAVLVARGLVIALSREQKTPDTGETVYGNCYRLAQDCPRSGEAERDQSMAGGADVRVQEILRLLGNRKHEESAP